LATAALCLKKESADKLTSPNRAFSPADPAAPRMSSASPRRRHCAPLRRTGAALTLLADVETACGGGECDVGI